MSQRLTSERLASHGESAALGVGQAKRLTAELLAEDPGFFSQIGVDSKAVGSRAVARLLIAASLTVQALSGCQPADGPLEPSGPPAPSPREVAAPAGATVLATWQPGPGILGFLVNWTSAANRVDIYLVEGSCDPARLQAGGCAIISSNVDPEQKPKQVGVSAGPGIYNVWATNRGPGDEVLTATWAIAY